MSGDVQPRKRKDKKKKRDDEEVKESHHGVNVTKMGSDDVLLHVQSDHGTGGHWCAKIFFFSLLAILFGLVGLIIMENRGLSDLDTPLSESRFSEYFEGWVDEHRPHDDHHDIKTGLEDQEHDAGPFEEEDDHSEQEEDDAHDVGDKDDHDEEDDVEHEDEADNTAEDDDDNETVEETDKNEDDEDEKEEADNEDDDEKDDEEDEEENNTAEEHARNKRDIEEGADDNNDEGFEDDDNAEENDDGKDDDPVDDPIDEGNDDDDAQDDNEAESTTQRAVDDDAPFEESKTNQEQKNIEKNTNNVFRNSEKESINTETKSDTNQEQNTKKTIRNSKKEAMSTDTKEIPIDDKTKEDFMTSKNENDASKVDTGNLKSTTPVDAQVTENVVHSPRIKEDDDFFENDESLEQVVENDAGEMLHLRQKAEQEEMAARAAEIQEEEESNSAPQIRPNARGPQSYRNDDEYIDEEIRRANEELFNDNLKSALNIYESLVLQYPEHPGALYGKAKVLDRLSDKYKSNQMLNDAIESYRALLALDEKVEDEVYRHAAEQCLDRMKFRGMHVQSLPLHRKLIRRFSNEPKYRNQLAVTYLLLNRLSDAKYVLHHTLIRWRDNGFAQAHYGFILKVHDNDLKGAVILLREGIASGAEGTQDGRFYFSLGDALYRLGEKDEAREVYRKGAALNLYPSEYQRSLYNVKGLKAQPFWTKEETTYEKELTVLERNWELIRKEAMSALNSEGYFEDETESLRDTGDWKQLELFARGRKIAKNCIKTPLTCSIIETFTAARSCRRGQVKFSVMHSGTHVWAHCGPTNCRLRAHLGLTVPANTTLRVATEERTWKEGEFLIFDDSFEHEVWHNGTSLRLVLIVDVWHPELTEEQRDKLSPI